MAVVDVVIDVDIVDVVVVVVVVVVVSVIDGPQRSHQPKVVKQKVAWLGN